MTILLLGRCATTNIVRHLILALVLYVFCAIGFAAAANPPTIGYVKTVVVNELVKNDPSGIVWRTESQFPGANGIYVGIENLKLPSGIKLTVSTTSNAIPVLTLLGDQNSSKKHYWVPLMGSTTVVIEVKGLLAKNDRIQFSYSLAGAKPAGQPFSFKYPARFERLDTTAATIPSVFLKAAESVAALYWIKNNEWHVCSGFMVSRRHFVTNHHCIKTAKECESARVVFGYRELNNGSMSSGKFFSCKSVVDNTDVRSIDVAALVLEIPPEFKDGPPALSVSDAIPQIGEPLVIIQHPMGLPMRLVRSGCAVYGWPAQSPTSTSTTDISHQCDTAQGSSGAPALNKDGSVVAIHHWGYTGTGDYRDVNRAIWVGNKVKSFLNSLKD